MIDFPVTPNKRKALLDRMQLLGVVEADLDEKFIRGSGKGGQKRNKTSSCVQILHRPSGTEVKCQKSRSQAMNRFFARRELCEIMERKNRKAEERKRPRVPRPEPVRSVLHDTLEMYRRANHTERRKKEVD